MFTRHKFNCSGRVISSKPKQLYEKSTIEYTDYLWQKASRENKTLFNGAFLNVNSISESLIECEIQEYKFLVAQKSQEELFPKLRLQPLAVSGILKSLDGWVIGKRATGTLVHSNLWEFVPSGGLEPSKKAESEYQIDFKEHLFRELNEELGITSNSIANCDVLCIIEDSTEHIFDIIIQLTCPGLSLSKIQELHKNFGSDEYEQIEVINSPSQLKSFETTPLTNYLIKEFCDLKTYDCRNHGGNGVKK